MTIEIKENNGMRKWVIVGLVAFGLVGVSKYSEYSKQFAQERADASQPSSSKGAAGKWVYSQEDDKMRSAKSYMADLASDNFINQEFPNQGNSHLNMRLQKLSTGDKDVLFYIDQGQLPCAETGDDCHIKVKFDDGPIQSIRVTGSPGAKNDTLFLHGGIKKFSADLRKAKKVVVEVPVYQAGNQQFTFEPQGVEWKWF